MVEVTRDYLSYEDLLKKLNLYRNNAIGIRVSNIRETKRGETVIECGVRSDNKNISWLELQLNKALGFRKKKDETQK